MRNERIGAKARGRILFALIPAVLLLVVACGGEETIETAPEPADTAAPETTAAAPDTTAAAPDTTPEEPDDGEQAADDVLAPLDEEASVRVAVLRVVNLAPMWLMEEAAAEYNVDVEFVEFARFADARTALAAEEVDFATFGPQDIALAMADANDNLVGLAGTGTGNDTLSARIGADIQTWEDLVGKSIGVGAGSISWVKFAASITEQGIDYGDLNIVNIAGAAGAYIEALDRGDIDLAVVWEPFGAQAIQEGIGEYPPFDHNESEIVGGAFATFSTTRANVEERPEVVQAMVNAYVDSVERMKDDQDLWVDVAADFSGLDDETVELAISRSELDYVLDLPRIINIADFLIENGVMPEIDLDQLADVHDYSFLSNRTGLSPEELGRTN